MSNADIDPPPDFVKAHRRFPNLLTNDAISSQFRECEDRANPAKTRYTQFGRYGLWAAFITFTAVIYGVTLEPWLFPAPKISPPYEWGLRVLLGLVGVTGVAAQLFLLRGPLKDRWLNARFRAERLRSIKFQAFQEAVCRGDAAVKEFTERALGDLAAELADATAARHNFQPRNALLQPSATTCAVTAEELAELKDAHRKLRIDRQAAFAIGEIKKINEERKLPAASSEVAFWAGALIAYLDAVLAFVQVVLAAVFHFEWTLPPAVQPILHFVTLELFVCSALLFVLERGRNFTLALERYEDYREHIVRLGERLELAGSAEEFVACVAETERQVLRELKAFCREAEKSTYTI
ncbi:MAG: hypothetical protein ACT4OF_00160 [Caulobacteraceae bacterium]